MMKRLSALFLSLCLLYAILPALAQSAADITGTWEMTNYTVGERVVEDPAAAGSKKTIVFKNDGSARVKINNNLYNAIWSLDGAAINLLYDDGDKAVFDVEPDQLVYHTGNQVQYFSKIEIISDGLGSALNKHTFNTFGRPSSRGNAAETTKVCVPSGWTMSSMQNGMMTFTDSKADPHYGLVYSHQYNKSAPENENTEGIKADYDKLAKRYPGAEITEVTVHGWPAILIVRHTVENGFNYDDAIVCLLRYKTLFSVSYTRSLKLDESEELYTFDPYDAVRYAETLEFSEEIS